MTNHVLDAVNEEEITVFIEVSGVSVWYQPPSNASAVAVGFCQYSCMKLPPLAHTSPVSPVATSAPDSSRIDSRTPGTALPAERRRSPPSRCSFAPSMVRTAEHSVIP